MKKTLAFALTLSLAAFAQSGADGTIVRRRDFFAGSQVVPPSFQQTTADVNYFVETTGNDNNVCWSTASTCVAPACRPCLTIQGTINKIPRVIRNLVKVKVGAGTFAGALFPNFQVEIPGPLPATPVAVVIQGTLQNTTTGLGTGTATGTIDVTTPGSGSVFQTNQDVGQTWAVNGHRGKLLVITSGACSTPVLMTRQIVSNTADTLTLAASGSWASLQGQAPNAGCNDAAIAGASYAIQDWATTITPTTAANFMVRTFDNFPVATSSTISTAFLVRFTEENAYGFAPYVGIDQFRFTGSYASLIYCGGAGCAVTRNRFEPTSITTSAINAQRAYAFLSNNSAVVPPGQTFYRTESRAPVTDSILFGNVVDNGARAAWVDQGRAQLFNNSFTAQTVGAVVLGSVFDSTITNTQIDCVAPGTASGITFGHTTTPTVNGTGYADYSGLSISNCATAINASGMFAFYHVGTPAVVGTGNTVAYRMANHSVIQMHSSDTLTGATEIDLDGAFYTVANVRALVPKSIFSAVSGARVFENP